MARSGLRKRRPHTPRPEKLGLWIGAGAVHYRYTTALSEVHYRGTLPGMTMLVCPFCESGMAWNACGCRWALEAQRHGLMEARKRFAAAPGLDQRRVSRSHAPERKPAGPIVAEKDGLVTGRNDGSATGVPLLQPPGVCASCDRRRALLTAAKARRRGRKGQ